MYTHCIYTVHITQPYQGLVALARLQPLSGRVWNFETFVSHCMIIFFPVTSWLWNSLSAAIFSESYNPSAFRKQVYYFLKHGFLTWGQENLILGVWDLISGHRTEQCSLVILLEKTTLSLSITLIEVAYDSQKSYIKPHILLIFLHILYLVIHT